MKRHFFEVLPKLLLFALLIFGVPGHVVAKSKSLRVKGVLNWASQKQTLTSCESKKIYSLRVLASNPYHHLSQKVKDLEKGYSGPIVADIEGEVSVSSSQLSAKNVDYDLLISSKIHSIERGQCP